MKSPDYCISKWSQTVNVAFRQPSKGPVELVIDSTGLKVYGEGEWKVRNHGA
ncbi:transposase [Moritella sp. 28]|nr:transposase [Moritella sp. 28]